MFGNRRKRRPIRSESVGEYDEGQVLAAAWNVGSALDVAVALRVVDRKLLDRDLSESSGRAWECQEQSEEE
jgi:hypothetical protein